MNLFYDSLVIIHPEYGRSINHHYKKNLSKIVKECYSSDKPIFLVDSEEHPLQDRALIRLFKQSNLIPNFVESDFTLKRQKEIDYICEKAGKTPSDTILAFGGIHASYCVYAYAIGWCKEVLTHYGRAFTGNLPKINPINQGIILDDIV